MNKLNIIQTAGALALIAAGFAQTAQADELLSPSIYGNELDRCVAAARAQSGVGETTPLRHTVTRIEKSGAWYEFTIESVAADAGQPISRTECKAHRFNETTNASVTRMTEASEEIFAAGE